jgi:outer membrane protein
VSARHLATAVLALSFAGARVQGQTADLRPTLSLSLDSAVTRAVQTATPLQNAQFFARISQSELTRSYAPIIPNANVAAYRTYDAGNQLVSSTAIVPWDSRIETMGYQLSTSLNVLGGLSAYPGVRAARYALASSNYSVARTRQAVALDAEQGYLQVILDGRLVDIAQQNDSVSRQQVTQVTELVRVGKRPPADLYRSQAQESADQAAVYDAINRQRADQISLLQELHIDPEQRITLSEPTLDTVSLGARYADTAGLAVTALAQRADLEAAQAEVDARRWGIRRAGSEALPTLNAGVSVLGDGRVFDQTLLNGTNQISGIQSALAPQVANQVTTVFSLGLGYNLLNVFQSHVDVQEARVAYSAAQLGAEDVRFQVTGDVARAIGEYAVAQERLMSARSGLAAAQASFDLTSGRYDVGFSSIVDLLTAQAALAQARSLSAEAVIEVSLTKRALAFALGLDPTDRLP